MQSADRLKALVSIWLAFALIVVVALLNDHRFGSEELFLTVVLALVILGATAALADEGGLDWLDSLSSLRARANGLTRHRPGAARNDHHQPPVSPR